MLKCKQFEISHGDDLPISFRQNFIRAGIKAFCSCLHKMSIDNNRRTGQQAEY